MSHQTSEIFNISGTEEVCENTPLRTAFYNDQGNIIRPTVGIIGIILVAGEPPAGILKLVQASTEDTNS